MRSQYGVPGWPSHRCLLRVTAPDGRPGVNWMNITIDSQLGQNLSMDPTCALPLPMTMGGKSGEMLSWWEVEFCKWSSQWEAMNRFAWCWWRTTSA